MDAPATPTEPLTGVLTGRPEIDLLDPNFHVGDPHPAYRWMRDNEPLYRDVNGIWCATTMELVRGVERRASDFVSSRGYRSVWFPHETSMISKDDPGHQQQRRIVSDLFTSRAVSALEEETRRLVRDALATTASSDHFDVVDTVAARIPAEITCLLLGLPLTHWRDVRSWSERLMRVDMLHRDPEQLSDASRAMHEVAMTVAPLVAERRGCPADDLLARWSNAAAAGCPMSSADINSELGLVIPGGAETTRTTLARSLIMFSERNDLWERLAADPASIPVAVEELLRWVTPLNNMFRTVVADCELAGHQLREGDRIALVYPSANRDDTVFDDPDGIDLARRPNAHVAFGFGPHLCLGAHVARLVLRVALEEMTARFTNLRPGAEPVYEANVFVKAVERFVLVADRR